MEKRIIRKDELLNKVGVSYMTVYRWEKAGQFPPRVQLGVRSIGWLESDVDTWLESRQPVSKGA